MEKNHNYAVVLAGGQGVRFWPLSRSLEPKQFLPLYSSNSLFQDTLSRINTIIPSENIFVVTNYLYSAEILDFVSQFQVPRSNIIFEKEGKNTAPSIAVASRLISLSDSQAKIMVLPSDHLIKNQKKFNKLLRCVFSLNGLQDKVVVFGIRPDYPATGYGYIKVGQNQISEMTDFSLSTGGRRIVNNKRKTLPSGMPVFSVDSFIEKPDIKRAKKIFKDKRYFWNSGIFFSSVKVFLNEIKLNLPDLYKVVLQIQSPGDIDKIWKRIKPVSFDYGVLEKTRNLLMVSASNLEWSDLGTWASLGRVLPKDKLSNIINADAVILESKNITVFGKSRLIACLGLENLIIVDTPDALLITRKDKSEDVKEIVDILKKGDRPECYLHRTVKRVWGKYTILDKGLGFKVRLVEVLPGKALTLQKHDHRSEHWVVVSGMAKVTKGGKESFLNINESTFIPLGCAHRLENTTGEALKIIEVQSGVYLEEDDIVRIKDNAAMS